MKEKKIVVINSGNHGSVGNVIWGIAESSKKKNYQTYVFCPPGRMQKKGMDNIFIGTVLERRMSDFINKITGHQGGLNYLATYKLIKKIKRINPDIIHLHNLHSNYVNLKMLFSYLSKSNIPIIWTLHDCWPFTGNCPHYVIEECDKWQNKCTKCKYRGYPKGIRDIGDKLYDEKKRYFNSLAQLTIVTPSKWLASQVKNSFLNKNEIKVINNGIDLNIFKRRESSFREKYGIDAKFIVLSVAFSWGFKKGLDRIRKIASQLDSDFIFVIVGAEQEVINITNSICISRTNNPIELAEIYSASDVFLNTTREDTFPTVNMEALACGLPVLSYGACGSGEVIDETCGAIVSDNNVIKILNELREHNFSKEACANKALEYDKEAKFLEYVKLYDEVLTDYM